MVHELASTCASPIRTLLVTIENTIGSLNQTWNVDVKVDETLGVVDGLEIGAAIVVTVVIVVVVLVWLITKKRMQRAKEEGQPDE